MTSRISDRPRAPGAEGTVPAAEASTPGTESTGAVNVTTAPGWTPGAGPAKPRPATGEPGAADQGLLRDRTTVQATLKKQTFFGEDSNEARPTSQLINAAIVQRLREVSFSMFDGQSGRLHAARLVNRNGRLDGDFHLAEGEKVWRAWRAADAQLEAIPRGGFGSALDVALLKQINATVVGPQNGLSAMVAQGGALRRFEGRSDPQQLSTEQIQQLKALGADVQFQTDSTTGLPVIVSPAPRQIPDKLEALVRELKTALANPQSDVVKAGAQFTQRFLALRPFEDGNERTARLVLDRALAERDIPPPIFREHREHLTLSPEAFENEVRAGVTRMTDATFRGQGPSQSYSYFAGLTGAGVPLPKPNELRLNGEPFVQGDDGFIYSASGRPHLLQGGTLQPLSQVEHLFIARRLWQLKDRQPALLAFTQASREAFAAAAKLPVGQAKITVGSELPAIKADNQFTLQLGKSGNEAFIGLFDLKKADPTQLFDPSGGGMTATRPFVISRHSQLDLELWHVQRALTRGGDLDGAKQLFKHREALFQLAKERLGKFKIEGATAENPQGFSKEYERLAYEQSPLSFDTLGAAIQARGDDTVRVWRGDIILASAIGMHPDYSPFNPDAFQLAAQRQAKNGTASIVKELADVAGSSLGTGYLCYTTDLSLLNQPGGFAEKFNPLSINLEALPKAIRERLIKVVPEGSTQGINTVRDVVGIAAGRPPTPQGRLDVSGVSPEMFEHLARTQLTPDTAKVVLDRYVKARTGGEGSAASRLMKALTDEPVLIDVSDLPELTSSYHQFTTNLANARDALQLTRNGSSLQLLTARRAFLIEMQKSDALPGIGTLGGRAFEAEQEVTGLGKVAPWHLLKAYLRLELDKSLKPDVPLAPS